MPNLASSPAPHQLLPYGPVDGIRKGARWRRDSTPGKWIPPEVVEAGRLFRDQRRGRVWNESDERARQDLIAQCWGLPEVADVRITIPQWLGASIERADTGEVIDVGRNPRARMLLAIVWAAMERGTMGVLMSREQWAQVLCCSPRSVGTYVAQLVELGLLRRAQTWRSIQPRKGEDVAGAEHGPLLLRVGPQLDAIALEVFARRHIRVPRGAVSRRAARELAVALRSGARQAGRALQREHKARRDAKLEQPSDVARSVFVAPPASSAELGPDDVDELERRRGSDEPAGDELALEQLGAAAARFAAELEHRARTHDPLADVRAELAAVELERGPLAWPEPTEPPPANVHELEAPPAETPSEGHVARRPRSTARQNLPLSPPPPCGRRLRGRRTGGKPPGPPEDEVACAAPPAAPSGSSATVARTAPPAAPSRAEARPTAAWLDDDDAPAGRDTGPEARPVDAATPPLAGRHRNAIAAPPAAGAGLGTGCTTRAAGRSRTFADAVAALAQGLDEIGASSSAAKVRAALERERPDVAAALRARADVDDAGDDEI